MAAALDRATVQQLSNELLEAERTRVPVAPLTERYPDLTEADAYAVQLATIERKLAAGRNAGGGVGDAETQGTACRVQGAGKETRSESGRAVFLELREVASRSSRHRRLAWARPTAHSSSTSQAFAGRQRRARAATGFRLRRIRASAPRSTISRLTRPRTRATRPIRLTRCCIGEFAPTTKTVSG